MQYYAQPENEVTVNCELDRDEFDELRRFLSSKESIEKITAPWRTRDHAMDPHAIARAVQHWRLDVHVKQALVEAGKTAVAAYVGGLVRSWMDQRNAKKQEEIEARRAEPILFDQYSHIIKLRKPRK